MLKNQIIDIQQIYNILDNILIIILPTENGWQTTPHNNRILLKSNEKFYKETEIIVTLENANIMKEKLIFSYENNK